jgi:prepilin-type N-terminal cleavage/methylation domain-containing protein
MTRFRTSVLPWSVVRVKTQDAFTLVELLVVIGIIALLMALVVPAFTNIKSAGDTTSAAYTIKGVLDTARTYAKANNTYTWVGFYEEDTTATSPTNAAPPYPGRGRVLLAIVASKDGTKIYEETNPPATLPADRVTQIGKLVTIEGIHVTDVGNPSPTPSPAPGPDTLGARPAAPYTDSSPSDHWNRINSESSDTTRFKFIAQNYTFYKAIRFDPTGEANIPYVVPSPSPWPTLRRAGEIGVRPTHGTTVDTTSPNVVAIQLTGVGGSVKIYRR